MSALVVLLVAGALTYAVRGSMVHALGGRDLSRRATSALAAAVPAGLAAMIVATLATRGPDGRPAHIVALGVAAAVARFTRRMVAVVGAGMVTLWAVVALGV